MTGNGGGDNVSGDGGSTMVNTKETMKAMVVCGHRSKESQAF